MKKKLVFSVISIISLLLMINGFAFAASANLTVGDATAKEGQAATVLITVDNPEKIAGAAFTIKYDTTALNVTVDSEFFDTFANQFIGVDPQPTYPVDGYDQPLVVNNVTGGQSIAAARANPAASSETKPLFTLTVTLNTDITENKTYPITVEATSLNYTPAGYLETGELIDLIVGSDLTKPATDPTAYPVLLAKNDLVGSDLIGNVTFEFITDTNVNGIDDAWEQLYFERLLNANEENDDPDNDGVSTKNEFINGTNPIVNENESTQEIEVNAGWNWLSFNVQPTSTAINDVLGATNATNVEQIKTQTKSATNVGGMWIGNQDIFAGITNGTMFKIKVKVGQSLLISLTGTPIPESTGISLVLGWNWIAFTGATCMDTATALGSVVNDVYQIKSQTQSYTKAGTIFIGNLTQMCPDIGYAIKMNAAGTLTYP